MQTNTDIVPIDAVVVSNLPNKLSMPGRSNVVRKFKSMGIKLADDIDYTDHFNDIQILIGADRYYDFVYSESVEGISLIPSKVGSMLSGNVPVRVESSSTTVESVTVLRVGTTENLDSRLENLWQLDSIGIESPDDNSYDDFKQCVYYDNDHYVARLPRKMKHLVQIT